MSRGGLKLEKALQVFPVDLTGTVVADLGASTFGHRSHLQFCQTATDFFRNGLDIQPCQLL